MSLQEFENDVSEFNQRVEDLDRRLGTVFIQAFDDAADLKHAFKVCAGRAGAVPVLASPPPSEEEGRDTLATVLFLHILIVLISLIVRDKGVCRIGLLILVPNTFLKT